MCNNYKLFINAPKSEYPGSGNVGQGFQSEAYVRPEHQIHVHQINLNTQDAGYDECESAEEQEGAARGDIGRNGEERGVNGRRAAVGRQYHQETTANGMNGDTSGGMRPAKDFQDSTGGSGAHDTRKGPGAGRSSGPADQEQPASGEVYAGTNIGTPVQMIPTNTSGCRRPGAGPGPNARPLAASISFGSRKMLQQLQKNESNPLLNATQDEARHRPLSGHPGDKLITKADHASAGKQFDHLDDQNGHGKPVMDDGGVISVPAAMRTGSYRGFEGDRNDNEEESAVSNNLQNQHQSNDNSQIELTAYQNNSKSDFRSGAPSPDIFLNAMRPQGTANQQDGKYGARDYDLDPRGLRNEASENRPDMSPSALLKPTINMKIQKIQRALEQDKARGENSNKQNSGAPAQELFLGRQFSFSPGLQAEDVAGKETSANGRRRKISGTIGSRKYADSASHEIDGSMNEFGSNPGLLFQQDKLNTNLPQVDAQEDLDQGPPCNITPLYN